MSSNRILVYRNEAFLHSDDSRPSHLTSSRCRRFSGSGFTPRSCSSARHGCARTGRSGATPRRRASSRASSRSGPSLCFCALGVLLTPALGAVLMSASTVLVPINARMLRLNTAPIPVRQKPETLGGPATSKGVKQEKGSRKAS